MSISVVVYSITNTLNRQERLSLGCLEFGDNAAAISTIHDDDGVIHIIVSIALFFCCGREQATVAPLVHYQ